MSIPYARPKWVDGPFGIARPEGLPVFSAPIPGVNTNYVLRQKWYQFKNNFASLALNTAHPDYSTFLLVEEGPQQDADGGVCEWTRTYAAVPATHSEWETFNYSFIGNLLQVSGVNIFRTRQQWTVKSRLQHDYVLVPNASWTDPILGGSPYNITTPGDIPKIWSQQYVFQATIGGATYGGLMLATDILNPSGSTSPTWPSSDQYQTMVSGALTSGWNSNVSKVILFPSNTFTGGPPPTGGHMAGVVDTSNSVIGGQLVAEDSRLDRWMGNIWLRRTRLVLAQ